MHYDVSPYKNVHATYIGVVRCRPLVIRDSVSTYCTASTVPSLVRPVSSWFVPTRVRDAAVRLVDRLATDRVTNDLLICQLRDKFAYCICVFFPSIHLLSCASVI
jgi:hypothetical protein